MAVRLRLCDEDREKFPGPEWVTFDEGVLDDLDLLTLNEFESGLNCTLEFLLAVDKRANTVRWTAARLWMARSLAGVKTPPLTEWPIKVRRVQIEQVEDAEEPVPAADAVPPDSSSAPSSTAAVSKRRSR